jgi:hypothetical protein
MSALNEYVSDERLWDSIEDVSHWMNNEGAEVIPSVIKEKIVTLIASTQRNERLCSIEMGTAGKGGVVKVYFDPLDIENAQTILQNTYVIRQEMQEKHKMMDINPQR